MKVRIIAKLDVKPPNVVKPVYFEGLKVIDTPENLAEKYYLQSVDEIFYIDIVASLYRREILYDNIKKTSKELFVPLTVGGGIQSIEDCSKLFHSGADKILINTHAINQNEEIINQAAEIFGNQSIVLNIEAKKIGNEWECYTDCGRIPSGRKVIDWVKEAEKRGVGEILLQSVDADGSQKGFDLELAKKIVEVTDVPVVVSSGAGSLEDIKNLIEYAKPSGVAIASLLHYDKSDISEIKKYLIDNKIEVSS